MYMHVYSHVHACNLYRCMYSTVHMYMYNYSHMSVPAVAWIADWFSDHYRVQ